VLLLILLTLTCLLAHFADHPIEDLIEKIACQFTAQHTRGRPRPPFWYPGFPLYVCDSQYNDCERVFVKITDWNGCIPEEVRQESGEGGEFMPIYPFEKVIWPRKVGSPFLVGRGGAMKGVKGPGGIVNVPVGNGVDGGGDGDNTRKKTRSDGNPGKTQQQQQQQQQQPPPPPSATTPVMATLQTVHAAQLQNPYQHIQQPYVQQQQIVNQPQTQRSTTLGPDRSIITAAGGIATIGGPSQAEKLPADTGKFSYRVFLSVFCTCSLLSSVLH
jgi:chromatin structure-remodeling complex subunit RSC1/2